MKKEGKFKIVSKQLTASVVTHDWKLSDSFKQAASNPCSNKTSGHWRKAIF